MDLKTLLKLDKNENSYISYLCGRSKTVAGACVCSMRRVQLTSQRAILSFSNVLVWTVENASKR